MMLRRNFVLVLRTILGQKLADFSSQNLVSSRTEVNLVVDEQGWNRLLVRAEHVRKNGDIACLWSRLQVTLHETIEPSNVVQIHASGRARFHRDKGDWHYGGIVSNYSEELVESLTH